MTTPIHFSFLENWAVRCISCYETREILQKDTQKEYETLIKNWVPKHQTTIALITNQWARWKHFCAVRTLWLASQDWQQCELGQKRNFTPRTAIKPVRGSRIKARLKSTDWPIVAVVDLISWSCSGTTIVSGCSRSCISTILAFLFDKYRPTVNPKANKDPCCISRFYREKANISVGTFSLQLNKYQHLEWFRWFCKEFAHQFDLGPTTNELTARIPTSFTGAKIYTFSVTEDKYLLI